MPFFVISLVILIVRVLVAIPNVLGQLSPKRFDALFTILFGSGYSVLDDLKNAYDVILVVLLVWRLYAVYRSHTQNSKKSVGAIVFVYLNGSALTLRHVPEILSWIFNLFFLYLDTKQLRAQLHATISLSTAVLILLALLAVWLCWKNWSDIKRWLSSISISNLQKLVFGVDFLYFTGLLLYKLVDFLESKGFRMPGWVDLLRDLYLAGGNVRVGIIWLLFTLCILGYYGFYTLKGLKSEPKPWIPFVCVLCSVIVMASINDNVYLTAWEDVKIAGSTILDGIVKAYQWCVSELSKLSWITLFQAAFYLFVFAVAVMIFVKIAIWVWHVKPHNVPDKLLDYWNNHIFRPLEEAITGKQNAAFGMLFTILYLVSILIIVVAGVFSASEVGVAFIGDGTNLEKLPITSMLIVMFKIIFTLVVAIAAILLSGLILLLLFKTVYHYVEQKKGLTDDKVEFIISVAFSGILSAVMLFFYFTEDNPKLENAADWIMALFNFGTLVSVVVSFMLITIVVFILLHTISELLGKRFKKERKQTVKYLHKILGSLIDAAFGTLYFIVTFAGDFVTNLNITAFDTLDDRKFREMEANDELINGNIARILYASYDEETFLRELSNLKDTDIPDIKIKAPRSNNPPPNNPPPNNPPPNNPHGSSAQGTSTQGKTSQNASAPKPQGQKI